MHMISQYSYFAASFKSFLNTVGGVAETPTLLGNVYNTNFRSKIRVCNCNNNKWIRVLRPLCIYSVYILTMMQVSNLETEIAETWTVLEYVTDGHTYVWRRINLHAFLHFVADLKWCERRERVGWGMGTGMTVIQGGTQSATLYYWLSVDIARDKPTGLFGSQRMWDSVTLIVSHVILKTHYQTFFTSMFCKRLHLWKTLTVGSYFLIQLCAKGITTDGRSLVLKLHCLLTHLSLAPHKKDIKGEDPDQTPQNAASDQGLHCFIKSRNFNKIWYL